MALVLWNGRELEIEKSFDKDTRERFIGVEIILMPHWWYNGCGWKKQTAANFYKRFESLAEDEGKSEIEYLKEIEKIYRWRSYFSKNF